jgi:hypothetical protein
MIQAPYRPTITSKHPELLAQLQELMELEGVQEANGIVVRILKWAVPLELKFRRALKDPNALVNMMASLGGIGGGAGKATETISDPTPNPQHPTPKQRSTPKPIFAAPTTPTIDTSNPLAAMEFLKTLD